MITFIYKIIVGIRNLMYDKKIFKSYKSYIPVISVGNITSGGTGKTPFVIFLVKHFKGLGLNPLIVSRGYKRKTRGQIVFNSKSKRTLQDVGDEPFLISLVCPETDIVINKNRKEAIQWAERSQKKYDVIVLDDAFQHRSVCRDFNILLINNNQNLSDCLPKGQLREPIKNIKRADCIVFTKSSSLASVPSIIAKSNIPTFKSKESFSLSSSGYKCGVAFCGIGDPDSFMETLESLSIKVLDSIHFKDHQKYDTPYINRLESLLKTANQTVFYTTQKDWVKLPESFLKKYRGVFVKMDLSIKDPDFKNLLMKKIN